MKARPADHYGDPAIAFERDEARTCKGCAWEHHLSGVPRCGKGNKHGKRCKDYKERVK